MSSSDHPSGSTERRGSPMEGLERPERPVAEGPSALHTPSGTLDIYNLAIQRLPKDPTETFFDKYARGDWSSFHPIELPADIRVAMPTSTLTRSGPRRHTTIGHAGPLNDEVGVDPKEHNTQRGTSKDAPRMYMDLGDILAPPPPDLTQSVEDIYRSFISDGRRTSHSNHLPTPLSEAGGFSFGTGEARTRGTSMMHLDDEVPPKPIHNPDGYAALHSKRYVELGYLEAPMPANEHERRKALRSFKPFHTKLDPNLDRIARLGKAMFSTNASLISLVDADEVQFTFDGKDPYMVPRGTPMCSHAVLLNAEEPLVVLDTLQDWRFKGNKVVTDELKVRFYAGFPMQTEDGQNIGVFCVLDDKPREKFGEEERKQLKELTVMMFRELKVLTNQKQMALQDRLQFSLETFNREAVTGAYGLDHLLKRIVTHISYALSVEGVLIFDVLNVPHGRSSGEPQSWHDRAGHPIPIMAASEHATLLAEISNPSKRNNILDVMFSEYPTGLLYTHGDELPATFAKLLPESVTAAAAVPVSRGEHEPFALICIYTLEPDYFFLLPDATLSFLSAMGLVLCSVQQKQVLSLADKAKIDFIANISHELRTPLHGVIASCDLLSETALTYTQSSFLTTAKQCASSLTETINHVLDFTKSTSQVTGHRREAVDLSQLVEETMIGCWLGRTMRTAGADGPVGIGELYAPQMDEGEGGTDEGQRWSKVEPLIEIEPSNNWTVMVDKAGLRRILINLIGNSMKFTQEGYVKLALLRGTQTDPSSVPIEIIVEDTGSGMSGTFIREKLFHPFSQEKPFAQGIGLGLAIVRAILKSPGVDGTIDVQSQVGKGTRMSLRFDVPLAPESTPSSWPRPPSLIGTAGFPSVAFVGFPADRPHLAQILRQHLTRWYGEFEESSPTDATILIVDADHISTELLEDPIRRQQKLLLLASSPIDKSILKVAQELSLNGGFCLVNLKPIGPHGLVKLLSRIVDSPTVKLKPLPLSPSSPTTSRSISTSPTTSRSVSVSMISPITSRKNSVDGPRTRRRKSSDTSGSVRSSVASNPVVPAVPTVPGPRVLVVEDNPINRKVLAGFLRKRGYEYMEAENGEEGVNIFNRHPSGYFDICLMDLQMPVMDGFDAAAAIRQIEVKRNMMTTGTRRDSTIRLQVYALSGLATAEDKERAATIGFDGYLVKPVSFKTLDDVFQSLPSSARWRTVAA